MDGTDAMWMLTVGGFGVLFGMLISNLKAKRFRHLEERIDLMHQQTLELHNALQPNSEAIASLTAKINRAAGRLHNIVPNDLRRYMQQLVKFHVEHFERRDEAEIRRLRKQAAELEDWVAALCGGRETMQAKAHKGLPAGIGQETRGRLTGHLEKQQIRIKPRPGGSGGNGEAAGGSSRTRGPQPQR